MTRTAVVTIVHGRREHLLLQHASLARSDLLPDDRVVVAMGDDFPAAWCPEDPPAPHVVSIEAGRDALPLAAARNLGVATALDRGAELVVLLDVDCLAAPGMLRAYVEAVSTDQGRGALLCGPVAYLPPAPPSGYDHATVAHLADPHPSRPAPAPGRVLRDPDGHRLFWSLSFAVTADTWRRIGGFDERFVGYGAEDTDLGQRAARAEVPLAWVGGARAFHQHHPTHDPPVQHVADVVRNGRLFAATWGWWPMEGWLAAFEERGLVRREPDGSWQLA